MKRSLMIVIGILFFFPNLIVAKDIHVKGYYRKDGTYVRPHIRSSPDSYKYNNYGPSKNSYQLMHPRSRDWDNDSKPNYRDFDDDNDGIIDDRDYRQYSPSPRNPSNRNNNSLYNW